MPILWRVSKQTVFRNLWENSLSTLQLSSVAQARSEAISSARCTEAKGQRMPLSERFPWRPSTLPLLSSSGSVMDALVRNAVDGRD